MIILVLLIALFIEIQLLGFRLQIDKLKKRILVDIDISEFNTAFKKYITERERQKEAAEVFQKTAARMWVTVKELKALQSICERRGFQLSDVERMFYKLEIESIKEKANQ